MHFCYDLRRRIKYFMCVVCFEDICRRIIIRAIEYTSENFAIFIKNLFIRINAGI